MGALLIQSMASAAKPATSAYEAELISSVRQLVLGQHVAAQRHLSTLTQKYPQSRLGRLVHADVLAAQAGLSKQIDDYAPAKDLAIIAKRTAPLCCGRGTSARCCRGRAIYKLA